MGIGEAWVLNGRPACFDRGQTPSVELCHCQSCSEVAAAHLSLRGAAPCAGSL